MLVFDIHRFDELARAGVELPLSLVPERRAGAHVSLAICKSTDIIRAVVEGITGAFACKKPRCPAWGDGWVGGAAGGECIWFPPLSLG